MRTRNSFEMCLTKFGDRFVESKWFNNFNGIFLICTQELVFKIVNNFAATCAYLAIKVLNKEY